MRSLAQCAINDQTSRMQWRRGIHAITGVCCALALALAGPANGATSPQLSPSAVHHARTTTNLSQYEQKLLAALNQARARHDAHAVKAVPCVQNFADHWSNHLAAVDGFYHQELRPIMNKCSLSRAGEIIAKGGVTPRHMIRMWLNSPPHHEIMLDGHYRNVGVSATKDDARQLGRLH